MLNDYKQEVARLRNQRGLQIAEPTLRRMVSQKRIPFTKIGKRVYFDPDRVDRWIAERAVEPEVRAS